VKRQEEQKNEEGKKAKIPFCFFALFVSLSAYAR
jgi:hypothetical protein